MYDVLFVFGGICSTIITFCCLFAIIVGAKEILSMATTKKAVFLTYFFAIFSSSLVTMLWIMSILTILGVKIYV